MKLRVLINIAVVVGFLGLTGWGAIVMVHELSEPEEVEPTRAPVRVTAPKITARRNYQMTITGFGSTRAAVSVQIVPEVLGKVVWRSGDAFSGRYVTKGQELFKIERKDYELACQQAQGRVDLLVAQANRLDQAEKNLMASKAIEVDRTKVAQRVLTATEELRKNGSAGQSDLDRAEEALLVRRSQLQALVNELALVAPQRAELLAEQAAAKAQLAQAELDRDRTTYVSPVTGRIKTWDVPVDQVLQAGRAYGEIYATGVMEVTVPVLAKDLQWLDVASLTGDGGTVAGKRILAEVTWQGAGGETKRVWKNGGGEAGGAPKVYVDRIEAGLKERTRTAVLVVRVENDPADRAGALDINMFCSVTITGKRESSVFVMPRSAVDPEGQVWVVAGGKLSRRSVKVIRFTADQAIIRTGGELKEGDRVVTSYLAKATKGMAVTLAAEATSQPAGKPTSQPASQPAGNPATR